MSKDKKSFVIYCDLIHTFEHLSNEQRGEVIWWVLEYVNDKDPEPLKGLLAAVVEPIKQQLKRDLKKWDDIKVFIEYGMISEPKFYDRAEKISLFKNTDSKYFTFEEYKKHVEKAQKDKDKKLVYLYANDPDEQHAFIASAKDRGYDVLEMTGVLDNHFINTLEQKFENTTFARVDADTIDKIIQKEEAQPSKLSEKEQAIIEKQTGAIEDQEIRASLQSLFSADLINKKKSKPEL